MNQEKNEGMNFDWTTYEGKDKHPEKARRAEDYDEAISVGFWLVILLIYSVILAIPYAGPFLLLIVLLIMSFKHEINLNLRNLSRALLILEAIALFTALLLAPEYLFGFFTF